MATVSITEDGHTEVIADDNDTILVVTKVGTMQIDTFPPTALGARVTININYEDDKKTSFVQSALTPGTAPSYHLSLFRYWKRLRRNL